MKNNKKLVKKKYFKNDISNKLALTYRYQLQPIFFSSGVLWVAIFNYS